MNKIFSKIDAVFEYAERRFGKITVMLFTGFLFLLLAGLVTAIRWDTYYHGNGFTRLSLHPFDFNTENDLRYRILSPLLGYVLFLRGVAFKYFMLGILPLFFGLIYFFQRQNQLRPSEALGVTALCAFSTISFHQFYFPAYTDPMSFLLILLLMVYFRRNFISVLLLSLMLFNHESTMFLFPFFFLLMADGKYNTKNLFGITLRFVIAFIPYLVYRKIISMNTEVGFTISYYFDEKNMQWTREHVLPHLASGVFQAFRLSWIIPLIAIVIDFYEKKYREIILILVAVSGVLCQFLIAYDISRLTGFAFPVLIISALRIRNYFGTKKFLVLTYTIILLNFFIPSWYIGALDPVSLKPFWME